MEPNQNQAQSSGAAQAAVHSNKPMAIISYLGPLVIIPFFVAKNDPFVKFHIKQGLVLFIINLIVWLIAASFWPLWLLYKLVNLATIILAIIGIVNAAKDREKELPIVGKFSKHFTF